MKRCSKCGQVKALDAFPKHRRMALGLYSACRECKAFQAAASNERNRDAAMARCKDWRERNPQAKAAHWQKWYASNGDAVRARKREDPRVAAAVRARQAAKLKATVPWATKFFIEEAYRLARLRSQITGFPWEVDHIVPLKHQLVCGLHVEHNLQVIPSGCNRKKGNRWHPERAPDFSKATAR